MSSTSTSTLEKLDISLPKKYKVIIKDGSDGSPINGKNHFVQQLMVVVFNIPANKAVQIINKLKTEKSAVVGVYPKQIAETLVNKAKTYIDEPVHKRFCFDVKMEEE